MEINETDISTGHPLPTFDWARDKIHTEDNHQVHQENARIQFHGNRLKVAAGRNEKKSFCIQVSLTWLVRNHLKTRTSLRENWSGNTVGPTMVVFI